MASRVPDEEDLETKMWVIEVVFDDNFCVFQAMMKMYVGSLKLAIVEHTLHIRDGAIFDIYVEVLGRFLE